MQRFRESEFIDFNTGSVKLAPIQLQFKMTMAGGMSFADLVRLFQCRMEVWHLGVAVQIVRQIEAYSPPSIWSHSAYGLLSLLVSYFEIIGQILNPDSTTSAPAEVDFDCAFRDVYTEMKTTNGAPLAPKEFYRRARNGLVALGSTQDGLWVHNDRNISTKDFDIIQKNPTDPATIKYYVNPHAVVRTAIDHFPTFIARLNDPNTRYDALRARFRGFVRDGFVRE
jgi:hypothetical protein